MKYSHLKTPALLLALFALLALAGCSSEGTSSDHGLADDNTAPIANAGADQHIKTGVIVTLDGSASSDADHDPLSYDWSMTSRPAGSAATLTGADTSHPTFTADVDGEYVIELSVYDGLFDSVNKARVTVTATPAHLNATPVADAGADQHVKTSSLVKLDGSGSSDADHDLLTYLWSIQSKPAGSSATLSGPTTSHPTFTADVDGDYRFKLIVNDGTVDSAPDTVTVTAATGNSAPVADAGPDQHVSKLVGVDLKVSLDGSGSSDADHDLLTYSWTIQSKPAASASVLNGAATSHPTFMADEEGTYVLKLIVNDGTVDSAPSTVTVTVSHGNSAPVADAGPAQNVSKNDGETLTVRLDGSGSSDADHDLLTYSWTIQSKPAASASVLHGAATSHPAFVADEEGTYVLKLIVNDGTAYSAPSTVTVTVSHGNSAPVAEAGPDQNVGKNDGETLTVTLDGSKSADADHDTLTYAWTVQSAPKNSKVTALTNPDSVAPSFVADEEGTYVLKLIVNDGRVDSAADTVTVTVSHGNSAPVANAGNDQPVTVIKTTTVTLDGSGSKDADGDRLAYSWTMVHKPTGSKSVLLSGGITPDKPTFTPDMWGHYDFKLIVNDSHVDSAPDTVTVVANSICAGPTSLCVFVTSNTYNGKLEGLIGADAKCNMTAGEVNLGGKYKAWLSDALQQPIHRFDLNVTQNDYTLPSGGKIADSWLDLLRSDDIALPINVMEDGLAIPAAEFVWTNTYGDGTAVFRTPDGHCTNWSDSSTVSRGVVGDHTRSDARWTVIMVTSPPAPPAPPPAPTPVRPTCDTPRHLYCFEQARPPSVPIFIPSPAP